MEKYSKTKKENNETSPGQRKWRLHKVYCRWKVKNAQWIQSFEIMLTKGQYFFNTIAKVRYVGWKTKLKYGANGKVTLQDKLYACCSNAFSCLTIPQFTWDYSANVNRVCLGRCLHHSRVLHVQSSLLKLPLVLEEWFPRRFFNIYSVLC